MGQADQTPFGLQFFFASEQELAEAASVLDLTEEQRSQIEALFNQQHQEKQGLREQMQASRDALHQAKIAGIGNAFQSNNNQYAAQDQ